MQYPTNLPASKRFDFLIGTAPIGEKSPDSPTFVEWKRDCEALIKRAYGGTSSEFSDFRQIRFEWRGVATAMHGPGAPALFRDSIEKALGLLRSFRDEQLDLESTAPVPFGVRHPPSTPNRKIFVVHGRDSGTKDKIARFLERLGLHPVILHEQASSGRTIIEKFEDYADVGFAVALLTADDVGGLKGSPEKLQLRCRQNVVLELGFFIGKLGRERVCALMAPGVEKPSDLDGIVYETLDETDGWRLKLAKEVKAAGYDISLEGLIQ